MSRFHIRHTAKSQCGRGCFLVTAYLINLNDIESNDGIPELAASSAVLPRRHGGIVRVAFRSCFYTQFDELLAPPLLAVLLFGLLRMRVTN